MFGKTLSTLAGCLATHKLLFRLGASFLYRIKLFLELTFSVWVEREGIINRNACVNLIRGETDDILVTWLNFLESYSLKGKYVSSLDTS